MLDTKKFLVLLALTTLGLQAATIATVNGTDIDERDLIPAIQQMTQGRYTQLDDNQKNRVMQMALEQAIAQVLIQEEAQKAGVQKGAEYKKALQETLANIEPKLASEVWLKQEFDKISVSESDVKKHYEENKESFNTPKQVHARHILVSEEQTALDIIKKLSAQKKEAVKDTFIKLAVEKSMDGAAQSGGDLGFFGKNAMVPEFEKAVFAMEPNSYTKTPVKTKFGYHVIYLDEVRGGEKRSFTELKPNVEQSLRTTRFQEKLKSLMETLKTKAKITYKQ